MMAAISILKIRNPEWQVTLNRQEVSRSLYEQTHAEGTLYVIFHRLRVIWNDNFSNWICRFVTTYKCWSKSDAGLSSCWLQWQLSIISSARVMGSWNSISRLKTQEYETSSWAKTGRAVLRKKKHFAALVLMMGWTAWHLESFWSWARHASAKLYLTKKIFSY